MNSFFKHPSFDQLASLLEGRLPIRDQAKLAFHIIECEDCSNEMTKIARLLDLMNTDADEDAPQKVISRAKNIFRSRTGRTPASDSILAVPWFDSKTLAPAFGVRSAGKPEARQLLFKADAYNLDLRIEAQSAHAWVVSGQILGGTFSHGQADLQSDVDGKTSPLNAQSEFIFPPVQAGHYDLTVHLPHTDIQVKNLAVGC